MSGVTARKLAGAVLLCMGLFSRFLCSPASPCLQMRHAIVILRCSEIALGAAFAFRETPIQFLLRTTAVHVARFSPFADVLTFLRLPRQTPNFASRLDKT
jgi:hypothetical protein